MNRMRNILAYWCSVLLLLAASRGHAQTVVWSDDFEAGSANWSVSGIWHVGSPTAGPPLIAGYRTHSGANCASTQNYPYNQDVTITCTKYLNGSGSLVIPDASTSPTLTFWHWYNFANALGYVEINGTNGWQQISPTYLNTSSGGAWEQASIDLSAFAGQSVQLRFHFASGGCCGNAQGWYVDDVSLTEVVTTPPTLIVPDTQTIYAGDTLNATCSATNSFLPHATYTFYLLSHPKNVSLTPQGVVTWPTTIAQPPSTNTIAVEVMDDSSPPLTATNSFVVVVVNPWVPVLTVPGPQAIYAGQPLTVTCSAANDYFPGSTFTFSLLSGLTNAAANLDDSDLPYDGVLIWNTTTALKAGTYTNVIKVTDNDAPYLSATNRFVIVVSKPPPPVLTVPPTQMIYVGQPLDVFVSAANSAYPDYTFLYEIVSAPAGVALDPDTGELTWTPTNAPSVKTITVKVTDDTPLSATNSFLVIVSPTPPPTLSVPAPQTIHAGETQAVTISATNSVLPDVTYTFSLLAASTNVSLINTSTNGIAVLTWTNTGIKNGILTWTNNSVSVGAKTINIRVTDNSSPAKSATNSFVWNFVPPRPPVLTVPTNQTVQAGHTLVITNISATNPVLPNATFTFKLPSPSTNAWITTNGVLTWTNTSAPFGTYPISVKVTDNNVAPPQSATNSLAVIVTPASPVLIVSNLKSNSFRFSFQTASNTTWRIQAATNLDAANWLPIYTNTVGVSGTLQFTDQLATNFLRRFYRAVNP